MTAEPGGARRLGIARLYPNRWPVRWRLAAVSAGLTLVILVCFALVVGRLATDRVRNDFRDDLRAVAAELAVGVRITASPFEAGYRLETPPLDRMAMANDGVVRIVEADGDVIRQTAGAPPLGAPVDGLTSVGPYEIATSRPFSNALGAPVVYVQYARDRSSVEATVDRLWLFLGLGVVGGTVLATLAGLAVAGRAMRPIAALTVAAREIAATRDPSRRLPRPGTDDEIGELATTLDEMLRQLDAARSETQQMVQAQREFVADASHELRTPLTSILANLELLQARLADRHGAGEETEIVASALSSSRRMRRLVSDLLLLARADAGRVGPRRPCDLREVASAALAEVRPVATDHELELDAGGPVTVSGSPDELHRLVLNLVENAVRHTPPRTEVRVGGGRDDGDAVLEIRDDGPGLPPDLGEQAFSRFVRGGGPADLTPDAGTGLGLAIVKAVAESHGGRVEATATSDGGAMFTVRLPAAEPVSLEPQPVGNL